MKRHHAAQRREDGSWNVRAAWSGTTNRPQEFGGAVIRCKKASVLCTILTQTRKDRDTFRRILAENGLSEIPVSPEYGYTTVYEVYGMPDALSVLFDSIVCLKVEPKMRPTGRMKKVNPRASRRTVRNDDGTETVIISRS